MLKAILRRWVNNRQKSDQALMLASWCLRESLSPKWYQGPYGIPDTINGRFDWAVVHLSMLLRRFEQENDPRHQMIFDQFFYLQDQAMREAGVGDLGVPKKMKKMLAAFYGRHAAYNATFSLVDQGARSQALAEALRRNLFPEGGEAAGAIPALTEAVLGLVAGLSRRSVDEIWSQGLGPNA
jgi:cytochrome b pre-mRNA-processing protein 3